MSLRSGELCPQCNGVVIGCFPCVTMGCSNGTGSIRMSGLTFSIYTCGDCGFSETYLKTPVASWKKTPELQGLEFEWIRPPSDQGPFR